MARHPRIPRQLWDRLRKALEEIQSYERLNFLDAYQHEIAEFQKLNTQARWSLSVDDFIEICAPYDLVFRRIEIQHFNVPSRARTREEVQNLAEKASQLWCSPGVLKILAEVQEALEQNMLEFESFRVSVELLAAAISEWDCRIANIEEKAS